MEEEARTLDAVAEALPVRSVYVKRRPREARVVANTEKAALSPREAMRGPSVERLEVLEHGARFVIRPGEGLSVGLFLDMRPVRAWLAERMQGRTLLNCFAYTCGFSVAALRLGASRAVNVDLSRRVLDWGAENIERNGQVPARRDFIAGDVFEWLRRFEVKGEAFDTVVLDPPSFSTGTKGKPFSVAKDYHRLVRAAAPAIARGGTLLACCNQGSLPAERFEHQVSRGLADAGRSGRLIARLGASTVDFPEPAGVEPPLKVVAIELR
jgi:23S rRNA (cytosine1962-C5)-methyltransferase